MLKSQCARVRRRSAANGADDEGTNHRRNITGPQSALTDFLASHNISATQIRNEALTRRHAAATQADANADSSAVAESSTTASQRAADGKKLTQKQKEEKKAIEKIKASKSFKKRKKFDRDSQQDDDIARAIYELNHAPLPGQMDNCEICDKRFTVTPYSVTGPNGGFLCALCGREIAKEREGQKPKKKPRKQTGGIGARRTTQSRMLDGDVGTKSLATLCVQTLAKNVELAESLGDLPEHLIDKIGRIFSKRRLLKPETLPLFVQPNTEALYIYDGAKLGENELIGIFQVATKLRHFKVRCAIQFKDEVMDYLLSRDIRLETFYLHGANLLSEGKWHEFLAAKGGDLRTLQVYYTDLHFGDDTIVELQKHCPHLQRLKVSNNQKLTSKGVQAIGALSSLQHLGLQVHHEITSTALTECISGVGASLQTLSLKIFPGAGDEVLEAIRKNCQSITKLRITDSEVMTDAGFANLFTGWENPAVPFIDLQKCRQLEAANPRANPDNIGLCSEGFKALMAHSGAKIKHLNVHACRHISREAFEEVFNDKALYPELRSLEVSFCEAVTDFILGSIFRTCPKIKEVNVFGCMKVKEVPVPRGVILVGVPNAQGMVTEGIH
ncbi:DNA repair protein Rad7 [Cordyceps fumosorosea ARSEF 2679]|uniref:DNA repair protein Rad7 n=1 Tax=Cordyceps fumosorosea (strain ARSEF 2679) TaxID=1081104 RepID=A0A167P8E3_CORFA|nr:DNA repair protein Rad7 [Cordyceps fumosorosea ARSEF 2679]OAA56393.1 DNA repair protein Rad7 [Cordyceps fumosorosea ARSEF 2679]